MSSNFCICWQNPVVWPFKWNLYAVLWHGTICWSRVETYFTCPYYMAGSASGRDEANPVFCLATREGKMGLSSPSGIFRFVPTKMEFFSVICWPHNKSFIDQACSVKIAGYWPHSFFCIFTNLNFISVHKKCKKGTGPTFSHLDLTLGQ